MSNPNSKEKHLLNLNNSRNFKNGNTLTLRKRREPFPYKVQSLRNHVLKKQIGIAVDLRKGNISSVRKQINALVRSQQARAYAVYLTISKRGYRSKGFSQKKPTTKSDYLDLISQLWVIVRSPRFYKATPLKRTMIPKPKGGFRPISVPSYIDRAAQHLYKFILDVVQEETADPNSFGFRPFRSPGWAAKATTLAIWSRKGAGLPRHAIEFDVSKCFDTIDHDYILNNIGDYSLGGQKLTLIPHNILKQWLTCGFIYSDSSNMEIHPTTGVPQGGPISPVICNMVFNGLESAIKDKIRMSIPETVKTARKRGAPLEARFEFQLKEKPRFCSLATANTTDINNSLKVISPRVNVMKRKLSFMLTLEGRKSAYGWTAINLEGALPKRFIKRNEANERWSFCTRFADDFLVLCNSSESVNIAFQAAEEFLSKRGMSLNKEKSLIKLLPRDTFTFVGFQFNTEIRHGKSKVYNLPPKVKVDGLLLKIRNILNSGKSVENCFLKANSVLRGWLNFYSVGNSKRTFRLVSFRLWHLVYDALYLRYSKFKKFKSKSQGQKKRELSTFIWQKHLSKFGNFRRWWYINLRDRTIKGKRHNSNLYLECPAYYSVATPSIAVYREEGSKLGLSAFHPEDRAKLQSKSLGWKKGRAAKAMVNQKGLCALCKCDLLDGESSFDLHHIKPIKLGGKYILSNLRVLCVECHKDVSRAVATRDINSILEFERAGILSEVSLALEAQGFIPSTTEKI